MWSCVNNNIFSSIRILRFCRLHIFPAPITAFPLLSTSRALPFMDSTNHSSSFASFAHSSRRTRILRHMASELNLNMQSDGYVKVQDLLKLNMKTFAQIPLSSHTVDDIREAVRKDNKQRFSLLEENGELLIRANQGHTITTVESESLLKPILSAEEVPVCVHGTYKKYLESILESGLNRMKRLHVHFSSGLPTDGEVISGMRRDVNVLIFLDVRKALEDGMKLYMSDNRVILTEGFDGVVPVKYFEKVESWPDRRPIPL
ncbi:tRNA 2'-phosphotransferase 1 isoform X2 [Pistacia vera]|uniref:tRNA 2'-phosphotransferase 1 isoform X2 n=1 Tax=Pistacia vera TaxID=55513 RepID=UPI001263919D|nr:tRNA 2'-phosphotransferase 1 isoform X2 [Pistacia vera]